MDTNLNVAYIGDIDHGVESIRIDPPTIEIAQDTDGDGRYETPELAVPHGLNKTDLPSDPRRSVYLTAVVPGGAGPQIEARLWSVNFEGDLMMEWGEIKPYLEKVVLNQVSSDPKNEKFNHYVSAKILVTADPKSNAPGLKILSGDYLRAAILPESLMDFELRRTFESQSIYSGPMGWNWDFNLNKRLLELPNGDLVYLDGCGRRERFAARKQGELIVGYDAPKGYFMECYRHEDGSASLQDESGTVLIFNALGRLARIMDRNANYMDLAYDLSGKLSSVVDTMGRVIVFDYYPYAQDDPKSNRLRHMMDFSGRKVIYSYNESGDLIESNFEGRIMKYEYSSGSDLTSAHNLVRVTDPKGQEAIANTYDSSDKLTSQTWGGISLGVNAGQNATTTDGNGHTRSYNHDGEGQGRFIAQSGHSPRRGKSKFLFTIGIPVSSSRPLITASALRFSGSRLEFRSWRPMSRGAVSV